MRLILADCGCATARMTVAGLSYVDTVVVKRQRTVRALTPHCGEGAASAAPSACDGSAEVLALR